MPLTKVSFSVIQVANNVTSTTVGNTTSIPSFTFDQNGVITSASNTAISGAGITANTIANSAFQTGSIENYSRATGLLSGMRNRIINGAMVIDQRNAGASVTPTDQSYTLDRWSQFLSQASKLTIQQNAGSVTPPAGFTNYLGVTSTAATTVGAGDFFNLYQYIEGFNVADLNWGTANAKTITLSFWVRSSLTGTFGGSLMNSSPNRSYPFTYTISAANTWEQKSITVAGDTSGTWLTTNGIGLRVLLGLGMGSNLTGPAGAWAGAAYYGANGATNVVSTNGATFYITGVQLEVGSTATSFDYRSYTTELQLCQRYLPVINLADSVGGFTSLVSGYAAGSTTFYCTFPYKVNVRTPATGISVTNPTTAFGVAWGGTSAVSAITYSGSTYEIGTFYASVTGLTQGNGGALYAITSNGKILFTGCEL